MDSISIAPRLVVTDPLGRRLIPIDKPVMTLGRRSEADVRVSSAGVSRKHAEIVTKDGVCQLRGLCIELRDLCRGERTTERLLASGTHHTSASPTTRIVFASATCRPGAELGGGRQRIRHMAGLLEGLRGSARAAIRRCAGRWCWMRRSMSPARARLHHAGKQRRPAQANSPDPRTRALWEDLRHQPEDPEAVFATGRKRLSRICSMAISRNSTPAR